MTKSSFDPPDKDPGPRADNSRDRPVDPATRRPADKPVEFPVSETAVPQADGVP